MTGPEHYRQAERYVETAEYYIANHSDDERHADVMQRLAQVHATLAQVHATLALVAATASSSVARYTGNETGEDREWSQVLS